MKLEKEIFIKNLTYLFGKIGVEPSRGFSLAISKQYKVKPQAVTHWINADTSIMPKLSILLDIAEDFGVTIDELVSVDIESSLAKIHGFSPPKKIGSLIVDNLGENWEKPYESTVSVNLPIPLPSNALTGIKQEGDSMTGLRGKSYPDGSEVYFNCLEKEVENGDLVLASLPDGNVVFRQFVNEDGRYLKALAPDYPIHHEFSIKGKFVFAVVG